MAALVLGGQPVFRGAAVSRLEPAGAGLGQGGTSSDALVKFVMGQAWGHRGEPCSVGQTGNTGHAGAHTRMGLCGGVQGAQTG